MNEKYKKVGLILSAILVGDVKEISAATESTNFDNSDDFKNVQFGILNSVMPNYLARHRSHSSHSSHGSHRSSQGGGYRNSRPAAEPLAQPSRPRDTVPNKENESLSYKLTDPDKRKNIIMRVQLTLEALGYYSGAIDGVMGPATRAAVNKYRIAKGLTVSDKLDSATLNALGILVP